jgi:ribose 5-phosphate isomerase RpiB
VCHDIYSAHQCVEHDDVNVACVGAQVVGANIAEECLIAFLNGVLEHGARVPAWRCKVQRNGRPCIDGTGGATLGGNVPS